MIIQKLLFPRVHICEDYEMYFRGYESSENTEGQIKIKEGEKVSLETYFNSFSIEKWLKYTNLENLSLEIETQGELEIKAYNAIGHKGEETLNYRQPIEEIYKHISSKREEISCQVEKTENGYKVVFDQLPKMGIVYVEVLAKTDAILFSGAYVTEPVKDLNPVNIAIGICTFKREKYVKRNVFSMSENIIENSESMMHGNLQVFISDNGQTLSAEEFPSNGVHYFRNKNAGGAGGFTRTMIESLFRYEGRPFTHLILMDDDVEIDTNVLERTYTLLQLVKEEYKKATVAGAMLEVVKRYAQFEAGADFRGIFLTSFNHGWDLRRQDCVSANEEYNPIRYSGWWFSCIPAEVITKDNLPSPQFIHYDDIEYGVRNADYGVIMLNGICVWHPYGENKQPVSMYYYDMRNIMIAMSGLPEKCTKWQAVIRVAGAIALETVKYHYTTAECYAMGIEDYFKGPEYFMNLDPIENHKKIVAYNDKYEDPVGIDLSKIENKSENDSIYRCFIWSALCWLLPALKKERYIGIYDSGAPYLTKNLYLYDENKKKGYWMKKSYGKAWKNFKRAIKDSVMILKSHDKMIKEWEEAKKIYTSLEFWEKYLEI